VNRTEFVKRAFLLVCCAVAFFALGWLVKGRELQPGSRSADQAEGAANLNVTINAPHPNEPGKRRFYSLRLTRAVRANQKPVSYDPDGFDPEHPGDSDWIVDVDGAAYWATSTR
jgi:hypothetical protein